MLDGYAYETRSEQLLEDYGFRIVARRYRCKAGEVDLIAHDGQCLVFVEVRARCSRSHGGAAASVDRRKQLKINRCAAFFLRQNPAWSNYPARFDVIAWEPSALSGKIEARWIQSAFLG
ncbi:MAG: YraN family protein [Congregibacter sp.]